MSNSRLALSSISALAVSLTLVTPSRADVGAEMDAEEQGGDVGAQMKADEAGDGSEAPQRATGSREAAPRREGARGGGRRALSSGSRFAAPTGTTGAGLSLSPAQRGRFWGELGFHTQELLTIWVHAFGGGYKLSEHVELELVLPFVYASRDVAVGVFEREDRTTFVSGDPFVGVNYLNGSGELRYKVGGGVALPFAPDGDTGQFLALSGATQMRGFQDNFLWQPRTLSLVAPFRLEYGDRVLFGGDASLALLLPTDDDDRDSEIEVTLAPGVGFWATPNTLLGVRLGLFWVMTEEGDNAQLSLEPNFRQHIGNGFFQARFTLNLDEPAGFSFDPGGFWAIHLGGGLSF